MTPRPISMHVHSFTMRYHLRHDPDFDVFAYIDWARDHGFTGVNISANGPGFRDLGGTTQDHFARVRDHLIAADMRCEIDTSDTNVDHMREMLHVAAAVGADRLRTYTRYRGNNDELVEWTVADLRSIAPEAEELGVVVVVENHEDFDGPTLARILGEVDHPSIGALYDYGNSQMVGEDPLDALAAMAPWVRSVHIKDHVIVPDGAGTGRVVQGLPIGQGRLPIIEQTERLYAAGLRRFCFENVWAYTAPVTVDPTDLPSSAPFSQDHAFTRLDGNSLPVAAALAGEDTAFEEGWRWLRVNLAAAGFTIEPETP